MPRLLYLEPLCVDGNGVTTRLQRLALPLLASLALSGCFVFDEIQRGIDLMDEHSAVGSAKKAEPTEAKRSDETEANLPEYQAKLAKWWNSALEEEPLAADPDNGIVRCNVRGKVSFTRKFDCKLRGGRPLGQ
jgi:hypothetical protein